MAYSHPSLQRIGSAGDRPVLWTYNSGTDNLAAVTASGYFNDAAKELQVGDVVLVMASDGVIFHRIATNNGTVVTTGTGTAIA
jgi:hypothetical protein